MRPPRDDMIVIDANIVFRAILEKRVLQLLEEYSARGVRFFAPDVAFDDARKYLPVLLRKRGRSDERLQTTIEYLRTIIEPVEFNIYENHEKEARRRLKGRDEQDWPVLASALALECPVWTEDMDFFGTGVAVWTTNRIEIFLEAQVDPQDSEEL